MNCLIAGCPGACEPRSVHHTARHGGRVITIDHVPTSDRPDQRSGSSGVSGASGNAPAAGALETSGTLSGTRTAAA
jgi:hypothetical protein